MNKCEQCGQDYEANRSTSKYCSSKCRLLAHRKAETLNNTETLSETLTGLEPQAEGEFAGVPRCVVEITESSPDWKKEPAYLDRIRLLVHTSLDKFKAEGCWIPAWRYAIDG